MIEINDRTQRGQSLVVVAAFLVALIAILALILDGGNAYLKRRQAQNAADSGALAGARVYCEDPESNYATGIATASDYVITNNASSLPGYPSIDTNSHKVTAATTITFDTFFGNILGLPQMTANAIASAGCYSPCYAEGVLPIVWTCSSDDNQSAELVPCDQLPITQAELADYESTDPHTGGCELGTAGYLCPELVIIKDNIDVDNLINCAAADETPVPGVTYDCDLDNDGRNDYISAENRGWSDLDGNSTYSCPLDGVSGEGNPELIGWIENGYSCGLHTHTWVGDQSGDPIPIYDAVEEFALDEFSILPIFSKPPCEGDPRVEAGCDWHGNDEIHEFTSSTGQTKYYHIEDMAVFYVTCVQTKSGECPAATKFQELNEDYVPNQYRAIEGYFISDYQPGVFGKCEFNQNAALTVYLDE